MDVSPRQIVSVGTALIPFLEHDDANRALMGANMQKQAVPLVRAEAPYIGTGIEARAARDAADMIIATDDGEITEVDGTLITVAVQDPGQAGPTSSTSSSGPTRTPASTSARSSTAGQKINAGDILANGPSTDNGELALGKNLLVAFMPWEGYNFEDAIILSRAPGEGRRAHVDPHQGARDRCPRHQARPRGDHPGHPEPERGHPRRPRRARDHPRRRRGRGGRRAGRQGHPQGRDRAHPRGAPAARHLRREGPRGPRHLAEGPPRRDRQGHRRPGPDPRGRPRAAPRRQPAGEGLRRPAPQDQRGRQARRPPRQQGRHLPDPAHRGHAVPRRRQPRRHHPQPPRRARPA